MKASRGFTLIELVIVFAVIGIAIAIATPVLSQYMERGKVRTSKADIVEMQRVIRDFERSKGALPDALADAGFGNRVDPWGRPYEYMNLRNLKGNGKARKDKSLKPLNSDFDLYSVGPDGDSAASLANSSSRDDVLRARDGRFVGTAEEFDP